MAQIPTIASYRGIGIHDHQTPARVRDVKAAIDVVARLLDVQELAAFAADPRQPPEARMFAASKIEAEYGLAAEERRNRPEVDLDRVRALVAGLDSTQWRDPDCYGRLFDFGAVKRERPLGEEE